ncbi:MAG: nucleotidyltransferase domain-containing protein [Desulfamplus sp.]|nr:nucleotidyltransferase domain-containing protein [Desulfamplus sp.]
MLILHTNWKKAKGKQYLFRSRGGYGAGKSLGPRSPETEHIYQKFHQNGTAAKTQFKNIKRKILECARYCKAAKINRVPDIVTKILRELDQRKLLGDHLLILGTNALYAYEAAAGVRFDSGLIATMDVDILWDVRKRLMLAIKEDGDPGDFIDVLCKADKTFRIFQKQRFCVVNKDGYMVDLLKAMPSKMTVKERDRIGGEDDLMAVEVMNLSWLLSSPKFEQVVIGNDGIPARMVVPDPRAFALHKFWVSRRDDREPAKKNRDAIQALAVAKLVIDRLPQLKFNEDQLRMFPPGLVTKFTDSLEWDDGMSMQF